MFDLTAIGKDTHFSSSAARGLLGELVMLMGLAYTTIWDAIRIQFRNSERTLLRGAASIRPPVVEER